MSVYQIEQYFISTDAGKITDATGKKIERYLVNQGRSDYVFMVDGSIIVDGFESQSDAENIEHGIDAIIEGTHR